VVLKSRSTELVFLLMLFVVPLSQLAIDIYTPSLPAMQAYFAVDQHLIQLSVSVYVLCLGIGQLVWGAASDVIGRRPILIAGTVLLFIGAVAAVFSQSIFILLLSRAIQGLGAAASNSVSRAVISDIYSGKKLMSRMSFVAGIWSLAPIVAPFIGGYLDHYVNWQANFVLLSIYTFLVMLALCFFMVETNTNRVEWQMKTLAMNYVKVILNKAFIGCLLNLVMLLAVILVFNTLAPFIYEVNHGFTSSTYGLVALCMGAALFLGTFVNRYLVLHLTPAVVLHIAQVVTIMSTLWILIAHHYQVPLLFSFTLPIWIIFFVQGAVGPTAMGHALNLFRHMAGTASAALGVLMYAVSAIILAVVSHLGIISESAIALMFLSFSVMGIFATMLIYQSSRSVKDEIES